MSVLPKTKNCENAFDEDGNGSISTGEKVVAGPSGVALVEQVAVAGYSGVILIEEVAVAGSQWWSANVV